SKPVRKHFTRILRTTLIAQCHIRGAEVSIRVEGGLMFVSGEGDLEITDALKHTFGIYAVDPFVEVEPTPEDVANAALQANPNPEGSFAIRCKRHGQKREWTSQTFAGATGAAVLGKVDLSVNLNAPDWAIRVALFPDKARLLGTRFMGPGGLPSGVQGLVMAHLDTEEDVLCAWLMMHRGCRIQPLEGSGEQLKAWDPSLVSEEYAEKLVTGPGRNKNPSPWGIVAHHLPNAPTFVDEDETVRTPLVNLEPLAGWSQQEVEALRNRVFS
ncbi:MAG: THUMP domain-containing protein, partial [Candidatus Poseidoniales archaeon]|nr:THUMP domain-containing protein [Candidatus Poseidoniales archaeon]